MANVYLKIEIKKRELLSRILIGMHSAINGNSVYIGNIHNYLEKNKLSPGIFLDKSISRTESKLKKISNYKKNGHVVTSMDEECGVTHTNFSSFAILRFSEKTLKKTSAIFCWGDEDFKFLRKKYSKYKNKFHKTGSARLDVCKILKRFDNKKRLKNLPEKKYAVISSNFGSIITKKPLWKTLADRKHYYRNKNSNLNKHIESEDFRLGRDLWKALILKEYLELIKKLSKSIKNLSIILRPHPSEVKDYWNAILDKDLKNVYVLDDYSSSEVLNFAEFMIHSGCHTALEAKQMDVPVISFNPIKNKKFERKFYNDCGKEFVGIKDMINYINFKKYKKKNKNIKIDRQIKNKFFQDNKSYSSKKISEIMETLIKKNNLNKYKDSLKNKINFSLIDFKQRIKDLFFNYNQQLNFEHKFNDLNIGEVESIINLFKKTNPQFEKIKFKLIGNRIIKIWSY